METHRFWFSLKHQKMAEVGPTGGGVELLAIAFWQQLIRRQSGLHCSGLPPASYIGLAWY